MLLCGGLSPTLPMYESEAKNVQISILSVVLKNTQISVGFSQFFFFLFVIIAFVFPIMLNLYACNALISYRHLYIQ